MQKKHLAQINIARMKAPLDDPIMKEFVDFIAPINKLAEESPGFVWRLKDEEGGSSMNIEVPVKDDMIIINMSVWEDFDSLKTYVYQTVHSYFVRSSKRWFDKMDKPHMALWWVEAGHQPTVEEAFQRLSMIEREGVGPEAFLFGKTYGPDGKKR